jgi:hypothetical protein
MTAKDLDCPDKPEMTEKNFRKVQSPPPKVKSLARNVKYQILRVALTHAPRLASARSSRRSPA